MVGVSPIHLNAPIPKRYNTIGTISTDVSISSEEIKLLVFAEIKKISSIEITSPKYRTVDMVMR